MTINEFVEITKNKRIGVPWSDLLTGQCVSLVQQYVSLVLNQPMKPRGNAINWIDSYVNEGLGRIVKFEERKRGDLIVYKEPYASKYGHIAIYLGNDEMYDQNNSSHDNGCSGVTKMMKNGTFLRPNVEIPGENIISDDISLNNENIEKIANDVIKGVYGNGEERKNKLGNIYNEVQNKVNEILNNQKNKEINKNNDEILELVKRTIRGDFGNGENRKNILGKNYEEVQNQVNLNFKNNTTSWDKIKLY